MEELKTLDDILLFVKEHSGKSYITMQNIIDELNHTLKYAGNQKIQSGLDKLVKDGYVEIKIFRDSTGAKLKIINLYYITYDGIIHLSNGGYFDRERNHNATLKTNDANATPRAKKPIFTLSNVTSVVTIIGVIIGFVLIPENTPWLGWLWWKTYLGM